MDEGRKKFFQNNFPFFAVLKKIRKKIERTDSFVTCQASFWFGKSS
jgi:hypothetical protein